MKKIILIAFLMLGFSVQVKASTRSDVKIIEASENIRYLSQKIAKEYLYLYHNPKKINLKDKLFRNMQELKENIHTIAINTQSDDSKNILSFLTYTNEEIQLLLSKKVNMDRGILLLDYSETFVEASNSIQSLHSYEFSEEEKMLMYFKELEYLLERTSKYYMANIMNLDRISNDQHMKNNIKKIENILNIIQEYPYPNKIINAQEEIITSWETQKSFLDSSSPISIPNLVSIFIKNFQKNIDKLELYHKKNQ